VQTDLRLSLGESLERNFMAMEVEKIEENFTEIKLGVQPGVVLFFTRQWAFEASVGIAGVTSRWTTQTVNDDQANETKIQQSSIDLRLNLLALNLGVAYYFDF
jgi:ABC-type tungstate transport system substrate-binding protein